MRRAKPITPFSSPLPPLFLLPPGGRRSRGGARLRGVHGIRNRHELPQPPLLEKCRRGSADQDHELVLHPLAADLPRLEASFASSSLFFRSSCSFAASDSGGRRGLQRPRPRLPHPPETAWRAAARRSLRSAAGCGHFSAARAPAGCPAAPPMEESSVPVGRRAKLAPPPPWLWRRSSVPVGRRSAARCGASQLPEPCGRSAVRVANAAAALVNAARLPLRRVARQTHPFACDTLKEKEFTNLSEPLVVVVRTRYNRRRVCPGRCMRAPNWSGRAPGSLTPGVPATPSPQQRRTLRHRGLKNEHSRPCGRSPKKAAKCSEKPSATS